MNKLTARQYEILDYIISEVEQKGYPPTVREIGSAVGLSSSSTVHAHLNNLEQLGYIRRDPTKSRAIEILCHGSLKNPISRAVKLLGVLSRELLLYPRFCQNRRSPQR